MGPNRSAFVYLCLLFTITLIECTEFVPCYMWSVHRSNEKVPALRKISQDTFKDDILEQLKSYDYIVVFAEETLSPEDFAQKDQTGGTVFPHLAKFRKTSKVTYLPYVQNPINALKHLGVSYSEIPASRLDEEDFDIPTEVLIVTLDDVKDSENRVEMLKRHDGLISKIYSKIGSEDKNVLAIYTAHHESWVPSEDIINARRVRSLLATEGETNNFFSNDNIFLYVSNASATENGEERNVFPLTYSTTASGSNITLDLTSTSEFTVSLVFNSDGSVGYWSLDEAKVKNLKTAAETKLTSSNSMYSLQTFSYHCGDQKFVSDNFTLVLNDFQVQLFFSGPPNGTKFSDAYDCVGFTSVPIWSGIFVVTILLMILAFGITMMMDIRTMDRFDDSKGKTITINTAE